MVGTMNAKQKAEAYDKALKAAAIAYKDEDKHLRAALERIFPELKESENEKTRKELIELIGCMHDADPRKKGWIAWLEKQVPVDEDGDGFTLDDDTYFSGSWKDNYHSWSIKDVKNGDVLHSPSHRLIWIYKDNEHYHACINMNYVTENIAINGLIKIPSDICPATSVQRAILFSKMEEAGYEWNADMKELKKLTQQEVTKTSDQVKDSDWSEEDEHRAKDTIYFLDTAKKHYASTVELDACIDWLKSLKDKVQPQPQPKQGWREEDMKRIQRISDFIWKNRKGDTDDIYQQEQDVKWLKSLKDRVGCEANFTTTKEWSEEDEKMLDNCINALGDSSFANTYEIEEWVKSLRQRIGG